ncbi:VVA0879 family protein [Streptomyces goshikiensis]|uniref:VVA0879 family protein n=1 Tax=Streptomyces goshikiensis TaxID=1942 RepID=UPI0036791C35
MSRTRHASRPLVRPTVDFDGRAWAVAKNAAWHGIGQCSVGPGSSSSGRAPGSTPARDQVVALPQLRARLTHEEWLAAGQARFSTDDIRQWSALCPRCGHVTSVAQFAEVSGTTELTQAFAECLGRHLPGTGTHTFPCDWAAWGHIPLYGYTVVVEEGEFRVFAFPALDEDMAKRRRRAR